MEKARGLTSAEAKKRLEEYGSNELAQEEKLRVFSLVLAQFKSPLIYILFFAGLTVSTVSLVSAGLLIVIMIFYNHVATYEEKLLENKYGQEYLEYKKHVPKWLPKLF